MTYVPHVFISVGETGAMFTLRETYLHEGFCGGRRYTEVRSFHHFNLANTPELAFKKAQDYANENEIKLTTTFEDLAEELRKINRRTPEDMERERQERQRQYEAWAQERHDRKLELLAENRFPVGRYRGDLFREVPIEYINWVANNKDQFEEGSFLRLTAEKILQTCSELLLPIPDPNLICGNLKARGAVDVTVIRKSGFYRYNHFTGCDEYVPVITMVTEDKVCLVSMTPNFNAKVGDKLKIRATVKEHKEYKGQAQTIINRIKVVD